MTRQEKVLTKIVADEQISAWLAEHDPMVLKVAREALLLAKPGLRAYRVDNERAAEVALELITASVPFACQPATGDCHIFFVKDERQPVRSPLRSYDADLTETLPEGFWL